MPTRRKKVAPTGDWLKVIRLPGYSPRRKRRSVDIQEPLFA